MLYKLHVAFATLICYHFVVKNATIIFEEDMKKILALSLLVSLGFGYLSPSYAVLEKFSKKQKEQQQTTLDYINYDWWQNLGDNYLEGYISQALQKNNDIKTAKLRVEQAKLNVTMTRADQLPEFSISASPFLLKIPESTKSTGTFAFPLQASYELDIFGKNWDKTKSSKKLLSSAQYQEQVADIAIVSLVGSTYYNVVKLDKIISLQEKLVEERKQIYELQKVSNKEGVSSTSDLILAEKNYVLAQNDLLEFKKNRENALNALAVLIGDSAYNTNEYKRISYDKIPSSFSIPKEISSEIIVNRPDYKALEKQLEAKGIDIRVAKKEFLPTINILGILTFLASSSMGTMDWANTFSLIGASASLPIFTGFKRIANLKLNKNSYQQLLESYQKTNLTAIQEVNDNLYNLKADKEKFENNLKALEIQKKDYNLSNSKFNKGIISKLDLLQQKEVLLYIEQLSVSSKIDCYIDKIGLYKATGAKV